MDYTRQRDIFDPSKHSVNVTIVGCGGIGSFTALALAKLGVSKLALVDFDTVDEHNIPNQLYRIHGDDRSDGDLGAAKVDALWGTIFEHTGIKAETHERPLISGVPLNDVVISALDSMDARADLWKQVRMKMGVKLFLDARLAAENIVLYSVNPTRMSDVEGYEATLHSDEEGLELPCTGRAIIDVGFGVASLLTRAVRQFYAEPAHPYTPVVYLDQKSLNVYKSGWCE